MGTVAGRGRQEKSGRARPAVAIPAVVWRRIERWLDEYIKQRIAKAEERAKREQERRARGLKPLKPLKRAYPLPLRGVRSPDRALRATIGEALACLRAAPVVLWGYYVHPDDPQPMHPETIRAAWEELGARARVGAYVGATLTLPRCKATLLEREMVRHVVLPEYPEIARDPSRPLPPAVLELIAERAPQEAASYHAGGGERRNLAREHFRWKVARAIEARCGEGSARYGWLDLPPSPTGREVPSVPSGLLFHTLWELRLWLPGLADATRRQLYDAFLQGRKRRKRSTRQ
jgi:hypothetical protein